METILHNELVQISYHPDKAYLQLSWRGHCRGEMYKQVMEDILDWISVRQVNRFLLDQKSKSSTYFDDTYWTIEQWYPKLVDVLGIYGKFAIVLPYPSNEVLDTNIRLHLHNKVFTTVEDAETWLCGEVV